MNEGSSLLCSLEAVWCARREAARRSAALSNGSEGREGGGGGARGRRAGRAGARGSVR